MDPEKLAGWLREEHRKVEGLAAKLHERAACVPRSNQANWIAGMRESFDHFRAHLTKVMALEEQDGYLEQVLERRPALSKEVDRLAHEHQEFARLMDVTRHMLAELQPHDELVIRDCCHRINDFLSYVEHHHNDENLIVLSAFNLDIGAND